MRRLLAAALLAVFPLTGARPEEDPSRLTLLFVGDIMAHTVNLALPDYTAIYSGVKEILARGDLVFANLESTVDDSRPPRGYPQFNVGLDYVRAAIRSGINVLSLANNHANDWGGEGVASTIRSLKTLEEEAGGNLFSSGLRNDPTIPFAPVEIRCQGLRIAFLAVAETLNLPQKRPLVNVVDCRSPPVRSDLLEQIGGMASRYDLFILSYHGGEEFSLDPEPERRAFFHELLEAGVDIVFGHHPHVVQQAELVRLRRGGARKLIMCSQGNFISGMTWGIDPTRPEDQRAYTGDSVILAVEVAFRDREATVEEIRPILVSNHHNGRGEMVVDTFEEILKADLSRPWAAYYQRRHALMRELIQDWGSGPLPRGNVP